MPTHDVLDQLDKLVPWVAFAYGGAMVFVFQSPTLVRLAETRLPEPYRSRFFAHSALGWVCLLVGGLWILQNLWLS